MLVSRILWGFNIGYDYDEDGKRIEVDLNAYAGGGLSKPFPFKARITPRTELHADMMRREWENTENTGSKLGTLGDVDKKQVDELDRMYNEIYPTL